jgi:hypothetical protein
VHFADFADLARLLLAALAAGLLAARRRLVGVVVAGLCPRVLLGRERWAERVVLRAAPFGLAGEDGREERFEVRARLATPTTCARPDGTRGRR